MLHPIKSDSCPCCGNAQFTPLLKFPKVPVSGIYRDDAADEQPTTDLAWEICAICGLLRNCAFLSPPDYVMKPRPTARQLPSYLQDLLGFIAASADKDDVVVEIGANDGSFLDLLRKEGYSNLHGIEPSRDLARVAQSKGHHILEDYFTEANVADLLKSCGSPKLVICRHTLEHVPDPTGFMAGVRKLLQPAAGSALLEVPDSTAIWDGFNFVELWDEHLFYFTQGTLKRLAQRNGLHVLAGRTFPHLETRNLLLHVKVSTKESEELHSPAQDGEVAQWHAFELRFKHLAELLRKAILSAPRPLYFMGASHPQTNLVNFLGLGEQVDFFVDDDIEKQGKFPPILSSRVQIISSSAFGALSQGGTLVLSGLGYQRWTDRLRAVAIDKAMMVIEPHQYTRQH